jgi:hypothetical protein
MKIELLFCIFCNDKTVHFIKDGSQICAKCHKKTMKNPFGSFFDKKGKTE